jgi:hypothetical protein
MGIFLLEIRAKKRRSFSRPILLRFLNVLTSLNGFIIKRIVFLFLVKYIASGTLSDRTSPTKHVCNQRSGLLLFF